MVSLYDGVSGLVSLLVVYNHGRSEIQGMPAPREFSVCKRLKETLTKTLLDFLEGRSFV
jgi:hypothetical protein